MTVLRPEMDSNAWWFGQIAALGALLVSVAGVVSPIITFVGVAAAAIYYLFQVIDHPYTQKWFDKRKQRKIAKLKARLVYMEENDWKHTP